MLTSRLHEDQPEPANESVRCPDCGGYAGWPHTVGCAYGPADICDRCHQPVHAAAADPDPDAARWYHNEVADDVFCGVVMHAADRTAGR